MEAKNRLLQAHDEKVTIWKLYLVALHRPREDSEWQRKLQNASKAAERCRVPRDGRQAMHITRFCALPLRRRRGCAAFDSRGG
jgi:hypothetical protein